MLPFAWGDNMQNMDDIKLTNLEKALVIAMIFFCAAGFLHFLMMIFDLKG